MAKFSIMKIFFLYKTGCYQAYIKAVDAILIKKSKLTS
ncbi:hypothetical protein yrohd0001_24600 [Yersinia rohdei ATCC 43380]|nr:hypothetical protein yrohd0001_24600 [Yersinia rohdei ATCC 43380]